MLEQLLRLDVLIPCAVPLLLAAIMSWDVIRRYRLTKTPMSFTSKVLIGVFFFWAIMCIICICMIALDHMKYIT